MNDVREPAASNAKRTTRAASDRLRIWAPLASKVELVLEASAPGSVQERRAAVAADAGSWEVQAPAPGRNYWIAIDDHPPRPDPRSRWQPRGVHGPSQRVADDFVWSDQGFAARPLADALIYELHVGTFTPEGTYVAALRHLPDLAALGVTHVELMPIATFPGARGWGYDGVNLFAPHPAYGTPDELKLFVARCHGLGLAVVLDVVYNHFGPDGNYTGEFAPYLTDHYRTPWGMAVNLDGRYSDEVRRFFLDNASMWLRDYHFDGLRLDAVHALYDQSATHFLEELIATLAHLSDELGRPLVAIAESDLNDPRLLRSPARGGFGIHAQWSDDLHHALHSVLTGERSGYYADFGRLQHVARALTEGFVYSGQYSGFRGRKHGRPLGDVPGNQLLGYLQTHDQIGNRACGERIGHLVDQARLRIGHALVMLSPCVPMLFQGEEWAASARFTYFTDHQDPGLAEAVRKGRREEFRAFGWSPYQVPDPQDPQTHVSSVLDWSERERDPHRGLLQWMTALARLRAKLPELRDGRFERVQVEWDESAGFIVVRRGRVCFQANLGRQLQKLALPQGELLLSHPQAPLIAGGKVHLEPDACALFCT